MLVHREEVRVSGKEEKEERTFCILVSFVYAKKNYSFSDKNEHFAHFQKIKFLFCFPF